MQTSLIDNTWDIIEHQISINKGKRINYKSVLGMTLTRNITILKESGFNSSDAYKYILSRSLFTEEQKQKIKISVCARYSEQNAAKSIYVRNNSENVSCGVHGVSGDK
jgi:hypothetical protein